MVRIALGFITLLFSAHLALAAPAVDPLLRQAATCTGRVSAFLEQQWVHDDPRATRTEMLHAHMTDFLFALVTADTDRVARRLRTEAKTSFRILLSNATKAPTATRLATLAEAKAKQDLQACLGLILPRDDIDAALGLTGSNPTLFRTATGSANLFLNTAQK